MSDPTATALAALGGSLPDTLDGTLDRLAALAAIRDAATTLYDDTLGHLERFDPVAEARADYDGYKHETDAGKVVVTSPNRKPRVTDPDAFHAYALTSHPDRTGTRERLNLEALEQALAGKYDHGHDRISVDLEILLDRIPDARIVETIVEERLAADLVKRGRILGDGETIIDEDGTVVPGLEAPYASAPRVTVTPDRSVVSRLETEILEAVGRPEIAPEEGPS